MHDEIRFSEEELEALFAKAVERLAAGDPFDTILDDIPRVYHTEIAEMLSVVEAARRLQKEAVPQPTPAKRAANKAQFLAAAAGMRTANAGQAAPGTDASAPAIAARWRRHAQAAWDRVNETVGGMNSPVWRLAPVAVILILVVTGMLSIVTAAKASVPGDMTYPLKEWVRSQELALAPDEEKPAIQARQEQEISKEVQQAAAKADRKNLVIEETSTLTFHGYEASRYKVGDFLVAPQYQPDPNAEVFEPMTIIGDLEPGAQVELTYRILPGQTGSQGTPLVQGVSMRVLAPPPTPTPAPTAVVPPTATPTPTPSCRPYTPRGWVRYTVRSGDTLSALAVRSGVSVGRIMEANCLTSSKIIAGERIAAPIGVYGGSPVQRPTPVATAVRPRPTVPPTVAPTNTPFPSATPTGVEETPTATVEVDETETPPTDTPGGEPTSTPVPPTDTAVPPTDTPDGGPTDTPAPPTDTPVPPPTDTPGGEPTETPIPPTDTPSGPTDTPVPPPTDTPAPPADTPAPPTDTPVPPPTDAPAPPTDTPAPPADTPAPPTNTPVPPAPTDAPVPPTDTPVPPPTNTPVPPPPTDTPVPPPPTNTPVPPPPTNTPVPPPPTNTPVPPPPTNTPVPPATDAASS